MKKILSLLLSFIMVFSTCSCGAEPVYMSEDVKNDSRVYECDYKTLKLNTEITTIYENSEIIITGNIFRLLVDPLTAKDSNGNILGYAGDVYGFISQDDHGIYVNDEFEINMCGEIDVFGETYQIKDSKGNVIANAEFNMRNTYGIITSTNGDTIATYSSDFFMNDYDVTIYDNEICSDLAILMIFASYVSDFKADSASRR